MAYVGVGRLALACSGVDLYWWRGGQAGEERGTARERERDGDDADDLDSLAQFLPNCLQLAEGIFSGEFLWIFSGQETLKERFIVRLKWFWN